MLRNLKRVLLLVIAALCSLVIVTDVEAGIIFRRGQSRRPGILARRSSDRIGPTATATSTESMAATGGAAVSGQTVRGQSPEGTDARAGSGANANPRRATNSNNPLAPGLSAPGTAPAPNPRP